MESERLLEVGRRIRSLRQGRGLTLRSLSEHCGLSVGFLSQIERGLSSFSVPSLRAICQALDVSLADVLVMSNGPGKAFFADPRPSAITKGDGRPFVSLSNASIRYRFLSAGFPGRRFEALIGEMSVGIVDEPHAHEGEEFGYVLEGGVQLASSDECQELGPGDSYHLLASTPHACNATSDGTKILWIQTARYVRALSLLGKEPQASVVAPRNALAPLAREGDGMPHVNLLHSAVRYRFLTGALPEGQLQVVLAELPASYDQGLGGDGGEEFAYVLDGQLHLDVGGDSYLLGTGDCYHLPATAGQTCRTREAEEAKVLWVRMAGTHHEVDGAWNETTETQGAISGGRTTKSKPHPTGGHDV